MIEDDKVKPIGVKFKEPPSGDAPVLKVIRGYERSQCNHQFYFDGRGRMRHVTYHIREGETEVECSNCGTKLEPMWVLARLASKESGWQRSREAYIDEMKRLEERSRTKCEHCGRMTRISRR